MKKYKNGRKSPVDYIINPKTGCWEWQLTTNRGYGHKKLSGGKRMYAHRYYYELHKGPIPIGLTLDHLCRIRNCVNPAHLEAVTLKENLMRANSPSAINARKTHCNNGHPFTKENTKVVTYGHTYRMCIICRRESYRRLRLKKVLDSHDIASG